MTSGRLPATVRSEPTALLAKARRWYLFQGCLVHLSGSLWDVVWPTCEEVDAPRSGPRRAGNPDTPALYGYYGAVFQGLTVVVDQFLDHFDSLCHSYIRQPYQSGVGDSAQVN